MMFIVLSKINTKQLLLFYFITVIILAFITTEFLVREELYYEYFGDQMAHERIKSLLNIKDEWSWLSYFFLLVIYILKFLVITLWILTGMIFFGYRHKVKDILHIVVLSEFVWLIPPIITLVWFGFINTDFNLIDLQYFKPLSLLNFFDAQEVESWLIFPLQSLNLFELIYIFVLTIGIKRILKKDYLDALNFTVPVYGSALVTWIVFITFLSINLTT